MARWRRGRLTVVALAGGTRGQIPRPDGHYQQRVLGVGLRRGASLTEPLLREKLTRGDCASAVPTDASSVAAASVASNRLFCVIIDFSYKTKRRTDAVSTRSPRRGRREPARRVR